MGNNVFILKMLVKLLEPQGDICVSSALKEGHLTILTATNALPDFRTGKHDCLWEIRGKTVSVYRPSVFLVCLTPSS